MVTIEQLIIVMKQSKIARPVHAFFPLLSISLSLSLFCSHRWKPFIRTLSCWWWVNLWAPGTGRDGRCRLSQKYGQSSKHQHNPPCSMVGDLLFVLLLLLLLFGSVSPPSNTNDLCGAVVRFGGLRLQGWRNDKRIKMSSVWAVYCAPWLNAPPILYELEVSGQVDSGSS